MLAQFIQLDKSDIENLNVKPGRFIVSKDSKEIFIDTEETQRIRIGDLIYLEKDTDRTSLLTPMPEKLYYVKETNMMWYYNFEKMSWEHSTPTRNSLGITNVDNTADRDKHVAYADNSGTVNGHTVNSNVPEDAKFTDTTYELVTTKANGLMSYEDKIKLNGLNSINSVSQLTNDAGYITADDTVAKAIKLSTARNIILNGELTGSAAFDGTHDITISASIKGIDASKITSGVIDLDRLPKGALERLVVVASDEERFKLTTDYVQSGDTVKVTATGTMYFIKDENHLDSEEGYEEYAAGMASSVEWSGVQNKPLEFTPAKHTHSIIDITDAATVSRTGSYNDLSDTPNIPTKFSDLVNDSGFITADDTVKLAEASNKLVNGKWSIVIEDDNMVFKYGTKTVATLDSSGSFNCNQIIEK